MPTHRSLTNRLQWAVSGVLLIAGFAKLFSVGGFAKWLISLGWVTAGALSIAVALAIALAEIAAGLLILHWRWTLVGRTAGLLLSGGFLIAGRALVARGAAGGCACMGLLFSPPPNVMFWVDLALAASCAVLVAERVIARAAYSEAPPTQQRTRRAVAVGILVYAILMGSAVGSGLARQRELRRQLETEPTTFSLFYGEEAPGLALPSDAGGVVTRAGLAGKWTLLSFVSAGCAPCEADLGMLSGAYDRIQQHLNVVAIVGGTTLFRSPVDTARAFRARRALRMPVACDADGAVAGRYCDRPPVTPFHVLLDERWRVRYI